MIRYTLKRLRRTHTTTLGVILFAVVLSAVLCYLQRSSDEEVKKYNETFQSIPVQLTVTNLSGTKSTNLRIPMLIAGEFTGENELAKYITDLQMMNRHAIVGNYSYYTLVGVTSTAISPELWAENGADIQWNGSFTENIFSTTEPICLVPHGVNTYVDEATAEVYVVLRFEDKSKQPIREYSCKLRVAGTYSGGSGRNIYCPYIIGEQIYVQLQQPIKVEALQATLRDNNDLERLRTEARNWFAEPNPLGERTPWGKYGYDYYLYALDIDDYLLQRTISTLQTSITTNRICAVIVLSLSASAGFLIGFLIVRSRKKEIVLMRTMGTSSQSIYLGFTLEQMMCIIVGITLGGIYDLWHPIDRLVILAATYFAGLTIALQIFLRKNLLTTIKEDD